MEWTDLKHKKPTKTGPYLILARRMMGDQKYTFSYVAGYDSQDDCWMMWNPFSDTDFWGEKITHQVISFVDNFDPFNPEFD